jgi:peroxiredoxin
MKYRTLIWGVISPLLAVIAYSLVYAFLTRRSPDPEKDWLFRLSVSSLSMTLPFLVTLWSAVSDWRKQALSVSGKVGFCIALLSLGLLAKPLADGRTRWKQVRNQSLQGVPAPLFATPDIHGNMYRLAEHRGQVVLVNVWATWCGPCRIEMPSLDHLYQSRKEKGLVVFGISDEPVATQKKFLEKVSVAYPLLTVSGEVPGLYRDIARYPATFLIDRQGYLQPAPDPEQSFDRLVVAVDSLLASGTGPSTPVK